MSAWYRDSASDNYVCRLCAERAARDRGESGGVQPFEVVSAEELREHFRGHRDRLNASLDSIDAEELAELERRAIALMTYDGQCEYLAAVFLGDSNASVSKYDLARLSRHIQQSIEDWLEREGRHA